MAKTDVEPKKLGAAPEEKGESLGFVFFLIVLVLALWVGWILGGAQKVRGFIAPIEADQKAAQSKVISGTVSFSLSPVPKGTRSEGRSGPALGSGQFSVVWPEAEKSGKLEELGQSGDSFGGFNALAAALACVGVFYAALLQRRTLREVRQSSLRDEAARRFEQTQSSFFEMLRLARELSGRVTVTQSRRATAQILDPNGIDPPPREGDDALDSIASSIQSKASGNDGRKLLTEAVRQYSLKYAAQPSRLGPYFRLLFQIFQLVDTSRITDAEKRQLANIARGQISEGAVLLLALNTLTWRGWAFTEYVERYGLLEHLHHNYAKSFKPVLKLAFLETAFLGSRERGLNVEPNVRPDPTLFDDSAEAKELRAEAQTRLGIPESRNGSAPTGAEP